MAVAEAGAFPESPSIHAGRPLVLELLDGLILARYERQPRVEALRRANVDFERLRYLIRLARDLQCISLRSVNRNKSNLTNRSCNNGFRLASTRAPESGRAPERRERPSPALLEALM